jgi:MFS family permease
VPILPYMLEERVGVGHDSAQAVTSNLLALYSLSQVIFSPIIGIIADRMEKKKAPLLIALFSGLGSTILLAMAMNSKNSPLPRLYSVQYCGWRLRLFCQSGSFISQGSSKVSPELSSGLSGSQCSLILWVPLTWVRRWVWCLSL